MAITLPDSPRGRYTKLNVKGMKLQGRLVSLDTREKTFEGSLVLSRKTGKPRIEHVIRLATDERDDDVADDDGTRILVLNEFHWAAFLDAHSAAGKPADIEGWLIAAKCVAERTKPTESDVLAFRFIEGPRLADDDTFGDEF